MARLTPRFLVPDTMLPVQFFTRRAFSDTPEKRLIMAVLMDAVEQLRGGDPGSIADAESWIRDEIPNPPIRFAHACEVLGFEPRAFADRLLSGRTH